MASISTAENDNQNLAGDDEWEGLKFDDDAKPNEQKGHEPDNETEHIVWGDINSETDTPEDSNSHGSGNRRGQPSFLRRKTALGPI